jgi:SAM-dependent methyltransferase
MKKTFFRTFWDFLGMPFRFIFFAQHWLPRFGWTTLEEERINAVIPHLKGSLLDIGAGQNSLVKNYGQGIGVDVFDWGGGAWIVQDSAHLPFSDAAFDSIAFIACLNHIPNRQEVLKEARRLIRPSGRLILTMIGPMLGKVGHAIWWYSEDKKRGGMAKGEVGGLSGRQVTGLCEEAGFKLEMHSRFLYKLNHLYIFQPK